MTGEDAALLDELVRLQVASLRRTFETQAELIVELGRSGISPVRIADLVGTSAATVRNALKRAKQRSATKLTPTDEEG